MASEQVPEPLKAVSPTILRITIPRLVLDGKHSQLGFISTHQHIVIRADTVEVRDCYRLPGRTLEILARRIISDDAIIDVSGLQPSAVPPDPALNGTLEKVNGQHGNVGSPGIGGGVIRIAVGEILGRISLVARGSVGGTSQSGGAGHQPAAAPDGSDGELVTKLGELPRGKFGSTTICEQGGTARPFDPTKTTLGWWIAAPGEDGHNANPGGDAGLPGAPGNGGAGGEIEVLYLALPAGTPIVDVSGGAQGVAGPAANVGKAGEPGKGGRTYLARYQGGTWWRHTLAGFADDSNPVIQAFVKSHPIKITAGSGTKSKDGDVPSGVATVGANGVVREVPAMAAASAGLPGKSVVRPATADELGLKCDAEYLEFILRSAGLDWDHGQTCRAEEGYRWVEILTRSATDALRAGIHARAAKALEERFGEAQME